MSPNVDIVESVPQLASRQQLHQNTPASRPKEYYRQFVMIPLLDHLISELNIHFDAESSQIVIEFMQLLPSEVIKATTHLRSCNFTKVAHLYKDDLPFVNSLDTELELWWSWCTSEQELAVGLNIPEKVLVHIIKDCYPNIYTLLVIMATLPVRSCECERAISLLSLIKSPLQSAMTQGRLNGLLQYHRDIELDSEEVVKEFSERHPRPLLCLNPFTST